MILFFFAFALVALCVIGLSIGVFFNHKAILLKRCGKPDCHPKIKEGKENSSCSLCKKESSPKK